MVPGLTVAEGRQHARYAASSADRLALCPGSHALASKLPPSSDSVWSAEGARAHALLDYALRYRERDAKAAVVYGLAFGVLELPGAEKETAPEAIQEALDYVFGFLDLYPDAVLYLDTRVQMPSDVAPGDVWGTLDVAIFIPSAQWLICLDYKHGVGVFVPVEESRQLLRYTCGLVYGSEVPAKKITLAISQPRARTEGETIRTWTVTDEELFLWWCQLDAEIAASQKPDAPLFQGPKQCKFCPAEYCCPEKERTVLSALQVPGGNIGALAKGFDAPKALQVAHVAFVLSVAQNIRDYLSANEDVAMDIARSGIKVPGFKLVEAQARRKFVGDPEDVAFQLQLMTGASEEELWSRELIGITDAEALVVKAYKARAKRGETRQAAESAKRDMAFLTLKSSSGNLTLVPDTDKRQEYRANMSFGAVPPNYP